MFLVYLSKSSIEQNIFFSFCPEKLMKTFIVIKHESDTSDSHESELELAFPSSHYQPFIYFLAIPPQTFVTIIGSALNILILWVLSSYPDMSYVAILLLNMSVCDVIIGWLGLIGIIGSNTSHTIKRTSKMSETDRNNAFSGLKLDTEEAKT